jgi:hypothetical protein
MSRRKPLSEYPDLIRQWDFMKNELSPAQLTAGSGAIVWWVCDKDHSWSAEIKGRVRGTGCPYCAGKKVLMGFNDLHTCNPELAGEWDYEKNVLTPMQVTCGSKKSAWWICAKGHSWKALIGSRSRGSGCPVCIGKLVLKGFNDLLTLRPDLAQEWDYDKNENPPERFTLGSNESVWWKCTKNHSWKTAVCNRSNKKTGTGCPVCAGKLTLAGTNDLQTLNPHLASQWDFSKNDILPSDVTPMSNKEAWWLCGKGHSWKAAVHTRNAGRGCPYCAGKRALEGFNDLKTLNPVLAQEWDYEKNEMLPSQVTVGSGKMVWWKCGNDHSWLMRVTDRNYGCGCPDCSHRRPVARHPITRRAINIFEPLSPELIAEWDCDKNELIPTQVSARSSKSAWWICANGHSWKARINRRNDGNGCPYCGGRLVASGFNDLQTVNPGLLREWDYEKNTLDPSQLVIGSNKLAWWRCDKGHSWECSVAKRHSDGYGCPYCSGQRVLEGFNDLQSRNPILANEWDYDKNGILPTQITSGSNKIVWWRCEKNHSWQAQIRSRNAGKGCPYCAGRYVLAGFNDLQTLMPELAEEWDYEKNALTPSQVTLSSGLAVWWKCGKGHSWKTQIQNRSGAGCGCPHCLGLVPYVSRCVK